MNDPYPVETDFRRTYFEYFSHLRSNVRKITFRGKQVNCLVYLVEHPVSSAYDIEPGRKPNDSNYTWAKLTLKKLYELGLIEIVKSEQKKSNEKHGSVKYSLTDAGIFYLIHNTKLPYTMLLQELLKNYHNSNIFRYLLYPYIKLGTLCSPKMDLYILSRVGNYLVSVFQKMDHTLSLLEKEVKLDNEMYSWNYDKLEEYLRNKHRYDFINLCYSEEDSDDEREEIKYFDIENNNKEVKIIFDKKSKKGYISDRNKWVKKHEIPLIADYLKKKIITQEEYMVRYFDAFCSPRTEEFILSIFSEKFINVADNDIQEILSNDKLFVDTFKRFKDSFDAMYGRIISYPNFSF
jgi:hypothetical protein